MNARIALLALILCPAVAADEITLRSGGKMEGIARKDGDKVVIETMTGTMTVSAADVVKIDTTFKSTLQEYYERAKAIDKSSNPRDFLELAIWVKQVRGIRFVAPNVERALQLAKGISEAAKLAELAEFAREKGLVAEIRALWERIVSLDPEHEGGRRALGYRKHQGQWLTEEEWQVAQGNVKFEGKWISKEERDLILHERAAKLEEKIKELDRREKMISDMEKALKDAASRLESDRKTLERDREKLTDREKKVKEQEEYFRQFVKCAACGFWYTGTHICPGQWFWCATCQGYFQKGHKCKK